MKRIRNKSFRMLLMAVFVIACAMIFQARPAFAKVRLNKKTVYLAPGDTVSLKVKGTKKKVTWISKKKGVAVVSKKGKVKAKKIGKATIVAKVKGKKLKCKVIVEKKNINRAKRLRRYVLEKGKYNKSLKAYELIWNYMDNSCNATNARITAYKGKYDLEFYYYEDNESSYALSTTMKINLISGSTSVKTGNAVAFRDADVDDPFDETTIYGQITTAFDGKGKGLNLTKIEWTSESEEGEEIINSSVEKSELDAKKEYMNGRYNKAFSYWNKMFSKKYPALKKAGVSMKSIGFGNWK